MKDYNLTSSFPGQEKGTIKIFIKHSEAEESVQLRLDLEFDDDLKSKNS